MDLKIEDISRVLEKISLNGAFLVVGGIVMVLSILTQHDIGLKIGIVTLVFGGLYRVQLHINRALPTNPRRDSAMKLFIINIVKLILWIFTLGLYFYSINKIYPIFT